DLPSEEEQEPTEEQIESYKRAERRAFMSMIANAEWKTARLTPVVNEMKQPSLSTLMALYGIRPEDPDAMEQARKVIDVDKALKTPLRSLFSDAFGVDDS
ncbi:MAG: hypothetical protein P4L69_07250, partial [Desulfosporosinus sp.]|nr:hypothetical protein [Desulfosporosinus sp.]